MDNETKKIIMHSLEKESIKNSKTIIDDIEKYTNDILAGKYDENGLRKLITTYELYFTLISVYTPENDKVFSEIGNKVLTSMNVFIKFCKVYQKEKGWS